VSLRLSDFEYVLPPELIAQTPARPRDSSRLLVLHRGTGAVEHRIFRDLPDYLKPGDVLVLNNTKVLPVRLLGRRPTGGEVEVLLLRPAAPPDTAGGPPGHGGVPGGPAPSGAGWEALVRPGRRLRPGTRLRFGDGAVEVVVGPAGEQGTRLVTVHYTGDLRAALDQAGHMPVPPYITRPIADPSEYQTVYAEREGAVAAPTAGLHFTPEMLDAVRSRGIAVAFVTLHVGLGTFRGVEVDDVSRHRMDAEYYELTADAAAGINAARAGGGRVVVVGTTVVRTLESIAHDDGTVPPGRGWTDLFITPGFRFRATDALVTNFHLPRTTLLMLVSAFAGRERILAAYAEAIRLRYRFYSFGDAMLILAGETPAAGNFTSVRCESSRAGPAPTVRAAGRDSLCPRPDIPRR
jgi:S-adenosylmethionine:tRNA ribosyltransferase-isomerase